MSEDNGAPRGAEEGLPVAREVEMRRHRLSRKGPTPCDEVDARDFVLLKIGVNSGKSIKSPHGSRLNGIQYVLFYLYIFFIWTLRFKVQGTPLNDIGVDFRTKSEPLLGSQRKSFEGNFFSRKINHYIFTSASDFREIERNFSPRRSGEGLGHLHAVDDATEYAAETAADPHRASSCHHCPLGFLWGGRMDENTKEGQNSIVSTYEKKGQKRGNYLVDINT